MTAGLVAGRFHLRRLLGSGGTASVFEADDVHTGGTVALKLLHAHLAHGPEAVDAFFEEVRAAQAIVHPNLAQIYDAGVDSRDPPVVWIAMELVPGVSLADHVRERGALDLADAVVLGRTVLDALTAVHASGVVHRDVSPANIMFDPSERASVTSPEAFARGIRLLDKV
ncbi:serine/threonine protein kinase [Microbacterium sp. VKM Ac-2870]|uniref:serine/threonine-protein kinase n=1 Tax=Microbacterium sp. VKM Ac-2870 TaxID=2783825 RepID=UPI00188A21B4|nr:serine/threonine-protein kinase [Microbacterium sp. VKM Ac-2870]MBF4562960.1 serine/threonine protein kinase [Microbacterium sp. VKM Ac-2870]